MPQIYLDHAATTAVHPEVLEAMLPYFTRDYYNPSTGYQAGRNVKEQIEAVRIQIASCIHAKPEEIYYTSGGTEGDNWILNSCCEENSNDSHIITTCIEHHAILHTCSHLEAHGCDITYLPVDSHGRVRVSELEQELRKNTRLLSIQYANNEIGTIQPIQEIGTLARRYQIPLHTDAVQACCHIPIDVNKLGISSLSASAHKFGGPKGVGFLYVNKQMPLTSYMNGGGQEQGLRAGTENVPGIIGMGKAIELANRNMETAVRRQQELRDYLIRRIIQEIPNTRINGHTLYRLPNNVNLAFQYVNGASLLVLLDNEDICVSSGSACNSSHQGPSHVIQALHLPQEYENGVIRMTIGEENTMEEMEYVIQMLRLHVEALRRESPEYEDRA